VKVFFQKANNGAKPFLNRAISVLEFLLRYPGMENPFIDDIFRHSMKFDLVSAICRSDALAS
jgi:hypothetical protein